MVKVVRLAEKFGQIGRNRVDEILDFSIVAFSREIGAILLERRQTQSAYPTRYAAVDEIALAVGERNSGMFVGQLGQTAEIDFRKLELAGSVTCDGFSRSGHSRPVLHLCHS